MTRVRALAATLLLAGCDAAATRDAAAPDDAPTALDRSAMDLPTTDRAAPDAPPDAPTAADLPSLDRAAPPTDTTSPPVDAPPPPCRTRITYGSAWIHGPDHSSPDDVADGLVTWDGACTDDGANSYAVLSNGWRPYFTGHSRCEIALDAERCAGAPTACETRFTYAASWSHAPGHAAQFDDIAGFGSWDGVCHRDGASTLAVLSNGWRPYFSGACGVSVRQRQCGARYVNPVIGGDCPDPGVLRDGADYYLACTSGGAPAAFPLRASRDLVHWNVIGAIFPAGARPAWASGDFWAPEIHRVGGHFVAYYTARRAGGQLAIGAARASSPAGPYTDLGAPLVYDAAMGLIDPNALVLPDGSAFLYWKEDGNAVGRHTPIHAQRLSADGLSRTGPVATVLTNDLGWEGDLVEGSWALSHGGMVYLFYSANAYYDGRYAVGVARASSPLGPFTKLGAPILVSNGAFAGPGHGSVLDLPSGETVLVYHAWRAGFFAAQGGGREVLLDRVAWSGGWPSLPGAPSQGPSAIP